ncbi:Protein BTR1 [Trichoplax sp. H2]|uniref:K Homology domain-containing protein n=1 Tax=Trichoplax adhaerens TaxID=10228 RepID=B3S381_TRIAD|nr:hypothetical protein TRIADDRAFT_28388 [Trichoplax adhaerens]EDV22924.1 hypothetical protein TRIADDRAFT_28388 [Trichoplax adhaerens]RDD40552.1 Protein BTR1 [Trichoplax sp. H2]|eukprot:XP_002114790.1 hypothetical protein TRIADDRAFT_28388 [Trichoplax adhaerens]
MNISCQRRHTEIIKDNSSGDKVVLKLLIPNYAAGSIIGKGGDVINDLQNDSKTRIRLSHNNDTFPGTKERVIVITGSIAGVRQVNRFILEKVSEEGKADKAIQYGVLDKNRNRQLKMIVPNAAAGVIIGKGGSNIKEIQDKSGAHVQVSQKKAQYAIDERILTVTGEFNERLTAWELIIWKCLEDINNLPNTSVSYSHVEPAGTLPALHSNYYGGGNANDRPMDSSAASYDPYTSERYSPTQVTQDAQADRQYGMQSYPPTARNNRPSSYGETVIKIPVPDSIIGAILGKRGKVISDIQNISGAHIQVSQRGDYIPGTKDREVTVTGTNDAAHYADKLIKGYLDKEYKKQASNFVSPQNY